MTVDSGVLRLEMIRQKISIRALGKKRLSRSDCKATAPTIGKLCDALKLPPEALIKAETSN